MKIVQRICNLKKQNTGNKNVECKNENKEIYIVNSLSENKCVMEKI